MPPRDRRLELVTQEAAQGPVPELDTTKAHQARVYDYWLGGKDNFPADRAAAEQAIRDFPGIRAGARAQRAFLGRAVRYLAGPAGIRQFLDIGTGIPAANNTHEVAQAVAPESRVVYVDNDPLVLAHARALLASGPAGHHRLPRRRRARDRHDPQARRGHTGFLPAGGRDAGRDLAAHPGRG